MQEWTETPGKHNARTAQVNARQARKLRQYARAHVTGEVRTLRRELQAQLLQMRHRAEVHRPRLVPAFVWERLVASVFARAVQ